MIFFEDDDIIICNKPAGVPTQTCQVATKDLVSIMKNHVKGEYLGLINRLDQYVGGFVVFAKNKEATTELSKQITEHKFQKSYIAVLYGNLDNEGELENYLQKVSKGNVSRIAKKGEKDAKLAKLKYRVLEKRIINNKQLTIVHVDLITGRHHQIRLQFANIGVPILGDCKYGSDVSKAFSSENNIKFIALYAYEVSFIHPSTKKTCNYRMELEFQTNNGCYFRGV